MTITRAFNKFPGIETMDQVDFDDDINVTTSDATVFTIDCRRIRDTIINLYNDGANAITYKIYGSANGSTTIPADADNSWFNVLNVLDTVTPANYSHTKSVQLPAATPWYESFTNQWGWIRITAMTSSGTSTLQVWARSTQK